ncbi:MAG TPA: hypothetical protein VK037_08375 [Pseudogracilibacillus sp.]|nr:hypothetical protein [Pseudogracilibacillus sp.]
MNRKKENNMEQKNRFSKLVQSKHEQLDLYTNAITKAHGESHPEAFKVRRLYEELHEEILEAKEAFDEKRLSSIFASLKAVTNNFMIPEDVCETYASVYKELALLANEFDEYVKEEI